MNVELLKSFTAVCYSTADQNMKLWNKVFFDEINSPALHKKTKAELLQLFVKVRLSSRVLSSFVRFGEVREKIRVYCEPIYCCS